MELAPFISTNF